MLLHPLMCATARGDVGAAKSDLLSNKAGRPNNVSYPYCLLVSASAFAPLWGVSPLTVLEQMSCKFYIISVFAVSISF